MTSPLSALAHQLASGDVVLAIALFLLASWVGYRLLQLGKIVARSTLGDRYGQFASQVGTLLLLEQAYEFTRAQIPYRTDIALIHGYRLLELEWRHGFFVEPRLERFFLQFHMLMNAIDVFYVLGHLLVTTGVIIWIFFWRRQHYPFLRNLIVITTAMALIAFYLYPTAPPRMFPNYGFVDPLQLHHIVSEGGAQPDSYTYNPYAAMPSLHVAYALVVSWSLFLAERNVWVRFLAVLYPLAMSAAVVITANHWLLDVAGAFVTVALASLVVLAIVLLQTLLYPRLMRLTLAERHT